MGTFILVLTDYYMEIIFKRKGHRVEGFLCDKKSISVTKVFSLTEASST